MIQKFNLSIKEAVRLWLYYFVLKIIFAVFFKFLNLSWSSLLVESILVILIDITCELLAIWIIYRKIRITHKSELKLSILGSINFQLLSILIIFTIGYNTLYQNSIGILVEKIPLGEFVENFLNLMEKEMERNPYPILGSAILIAPIFEEILFRGIFLKGFLGKYKPINAILLSALLFGIIHFNIPQFINAFFIGIILGTVYYSTQSLVLCIVVHLLNNCMAIFFEYKNIEPSLIGFIIGVLLFLPGLRFIHKIGLLDLESTDSSELS